MENFKEQMKAVWRRVDQFVDEVCIPEWRKFWKVGTFYVFLAIGALPDLWNMMVNGGVISAEDIPKDFSWLVKGMAIVGTLVRFWNQQYMLIRKKLADDVQAELKSEITGRTEASQEQRNIAQILHDHAIEQSEVGAQDLGDDGREYRYHRRDEPDEDAGIGSGVRW